MNKSVILLVLVSVMVIETGLSFNAFAICTSCSGEQDWAASATNFLEGKPINDTPSGLSNPQRIRQMNSDFNSKLLKEDNVKPANSPSNPITTSTLNTSTLNTSLKDINAVPNPVKPGSPVMITASFGNNSSNTQSIPQINMTVYAIIRDSAGVEVGKVNLERTSGENYAGIWSHLTAGAYKTTIVASAPGALKTFTDVLQIDVGKAV